MDKEPQKTGGPFNVIGCDEMLQNLVAYILQDAFDAVLVALCVVAALILLLFLLYVAVRVVSLGVFKSWRAVKDRENEERSNQHGV